MNIFSNALKALVAAATAASFPSLVEGHGQLEKPMSRNFYAYHHGATSSDKPGVPLKDVNYNSVNNNVGVCGKTQAFNAPGHPEIDYTWEWNDTQGNPMPWISQETYQRGQEIEVVVHLTTEHCGFFEFKACPMGRDSSQECLDYYQLEFVRDISETVKPQMPKDWDYPERAYFPHKVTGHKLKYVMKLPDNLVGEQVLLQWMYWTANSCYMKGYDQYITETANIPWGDLCAGYECYERDEIPMIRDPAEKHNYIPEIFWNCAEVTIVGDPVDDVPSFEPIKPPPPTAPVAPAPPVAPTPDNPNGTCGGGNVGNGICPSNHHCCSKHGNCGSGPAWCDDPADVTPTAPVAPTPAQTSPPMSAPTPVTNPTPITAPTPVTDNGNGCCSYDFKTCASYGNESKQVCENMGGMKWLENGALEDQTCLGKDAACTGNIQGCCNGLTCNGNQYYMQCQYLPDVGRIRAF